MLKIRCLIANNTLQWWLSNYSPYYRGDWSMDESAAMLLTKTLADEIISDYRRRVSTLKVEAVKV